MKISWHFSIHLTLAELPVLMQSKYIEVNPEKTVVTSLNTQKVNPEKILTADVYILSF